MGSQHGNPATGLHCHRKTPHRKGLQHRPVAARAKFGPLAKAQNVELRLITGGMKIITGGMKIITGGMKIITGGMKIITGDIKIISISEAETAAGLLSVENRREELIRQCEKHEKLAFAPALQPWSFHQEQTAETESKPPDQSTSAKAPASYNSKQPTAGNTPRLRELASRNSRHPSPYPWRLFQGP